MLLLVYLFIISLLYMFDIFSLFCILLMYSIVLWMNEINIELKLKIVVDVNSEVVFTMITLVLPLLNTTVSLLSPQAFVVTNKPLILPLQYWKLSKIQSVSIIFDFWKYIQCQYLFVLVE